ncbi:unnamed protein product [marine sediment metagenome]|uniref:Polymerase nucleotidyl transferase domain-containing protein n=1 Tax=marine sediment metagenome TaxID=412755 RepID=X0WQN7_9ZZZZ
MPLDDIAQEFVNRVLPNLKEKYHPVEVWLWGSHVYGHPHEYSDLDVIVVSEDFRGERFIDRQVRLVNELDLFYDDVIGVVDPICYTPEEFEKKKNRVCVIQEALKKGVRVL